ncbi:Dihydropteroate synthase-like protein [Collybia nuda]|uniref:Dihydropteroate synthase-like protein n=1 Tax=Collybia nuda TaxID=64659 RepID=A0A9P5YF33_9AGAR|nr:Dihydropteroate synthase-like protein [Collybia nuda]
MCESGQVVAIALGSNIGDSFHNIELALRLLETPNQVFTPKEREDMSDDSFVAVIDTSFLYETAPMYVTDQPSFINCACLIETNLSPVELLKFLKHIELAVGRVPSIRNGPRAVDLDVILYGNTILDTRPLQERDNLDNLINQLVIPHPRMHEREFVLRPLNDMIPDYIHPVHKKSISKLLRELPEEDASMKKVVPFPTYPLPPNYVWSFPGVPVVPPTLTHWTHTSSLTPHQPGKKRKTHLMATLNATPDSFSDGLVHNTIDTALEYASKAVQDGATIIDIGGYSTKPGAAFVSPEEEEQRVVPVIKAMRNMAPSDEDSTASATEVVSDTNSRVRAVPISVDTFRWEVAKAAILAGANCINDVYAFTGRDTYPVVDDDQKGRAEASMTEMKRVAREYAVPVILMHSRGDAGMNKDYEMYKSGGASGVVVNGIQVELGTKVEKIIKGKGGVRRWMIIVDPGVGFSKTLEGNLEVLRDASSIVSDIRVHNDGSTTHNHLRGYPLLIGASRKSFLGTILSQGDSGRVTEPMERGWATSAAVACAVQQGSLVVRVHDTKEMADVISVATELWG